MRSLSVKERATMSPGGWARSTGSANSSRLVDVVARICMG
jgi:hypothetical protein